MTRQEFDAIVNDAVKNGGATRANAEAYVRAGHKLAANAFTEAKPKKAAAKKAAKK